MTGWTWAMLFLTVVAIGLLGAEIAAGDTFSTVVAVVATLVCGIGFVREIGRTL